MITLPSFCGITNEGKSLNLKANFLSNNGYRVRRGQNSLELCNRAYNLLPVYAHKYFGKISGWHRLSSHENMTDSFNKVVFMSRFLLEVNRTFCVVIRGPWSESFHCWYISIFDSWSFSSARKPPYKYFRNVSDIDVDLDFPRCL